MRNTEESKILEVLSGEGSNDADHVLYTLRETLRQIETEGQDENANPPETNLPGGLQVCSDTPTSSVIVDEVSPAPGNVGLSQRQTANSSTVPVLNNQRRDSVGEQTGLRHRRSSRREDPPQEEEPENVTGGIFGSPASKPSKWSLGHYLQSVASTREKRIVALSAWGIAVVGLVVSLVFVTKDFLDSRQEQTSTVRYEDASILELPSLWLCTADSQIPPFSDLPNAEYRGQPLLWLDYVRGTHANINYTYPETKNLEQLEVGSYDATGKECDALTSMDPGTYYEENTAKPKCFYCLTLIRAPPITIKRESETRDGISISRPASLRISQHAFLSQCRSSQFGLTLVILRFFRDEMKLHEKELRERGILDFGDYDPTNSLHDQYLWPSYRMGFQNATVDFVVYDIVDMFCNVYLFSGLFYPSTSSGIKYRFNSRVYRWERSGGGPYYPPIYSEYYSSEGSIVLYSATPVISSEKYENRSMFQSDTLEIRTNYSWLGEAETLAVLSASEIASVGLSRNLIFGKESFSSNVLRTAVSPGDVRAVNNIYFLDIGFKTFLTRLVSEQQAISWSAFAADFFGLTSLFLDVSVYTLIVAPLLMRGRQRAATARKQQNSGGSGES